MNRRSVAAGALVAVMVCVLAGCSRQAREKRHYEAAQKYEKQGKLEKAGLEYRNVLAFDSRSADAHLGLARVLWREGDPLGSVIELRKTLQISPGDPEAALRLGRLYLAAGHLDQAAQEADAVLKRDPGNSDAQVLNGLVLLRKGHAEEAKATFDSVLAKQNHSPQAWMALAAYYETQKDVAGTEKALRQAATADPHSASALLALGEFLEGQGRSRDAQQANEEARQREPKNAGVLMALAKFYERSGNSALAEATLKDVRNLASPNSKPRMVLADYYLAKGNKAAAITELRARIRRDGVDGLEGQKLGELFIDGNQTQDAEALILQILHANRTSAVAEFLEGRIELVQGDPVKAFGSFQQALRFMATSPELFYYEGGSLLEQNKQAAAQSAFSHSLSLDPTYAPSRLELGKLELAGGNPKGALQNAVTLLRLRPTADAWLLYVNALIGNGRSNAAVKLLTLLSERVKESPARAAFLERLALLDLSQKSYAQARAELDKARADTPDSSTPDKLMAASYVMQNQDPAAEQILSTAQAKYPSDVQVKQLLAQTLLKEKRFSQARAIYSGLLTKHPHNEAALTGLAQVSVAQKDWPGAAREFEVAAKDTQSASYFVMAGEIYEKAGNEKQAKQDYQEALRLDPKNPAALNNLSWIYLHDGGDVDMAVSYAEQAKRLMPNSPQVTDTLAWAYYTKARYAFAVSLLQDAIRTDPHEAMFFYHLGKCYLKMNSRVQAKQAFEQALRGEGTFPRQDTWAELRGLESSR